MAPSPPPSIQAVLKRDWKVVSGIPELKKKRKSAAQTLLNDKAIVINVGNLFPSARLFDSHAHLEALSDEFNSVRRQRMSISCGVTVIRPRVAQE